VVVAGSNAASATGTLTVQNGFVTTVDGLKFTPFNTNAPVTIINASGADTQTPSAVSTNVFSNVYGQTATVTATTWTYAHAPGDRVNSGTAGLQEALNFASAIGGGEVLVDAAWYAQGGTATILAAATVPASVSILDVSAGSVTMSKTVTIPAASILTLNSVGYPLVAAPGAGNLIVVDRLIVQCNPLTAAFANGGNLTAAYGTQAAQIACTGTIAATVFTASSTLKEIGMAIGLAPANGVSTGWVNSAVGLYAASADFITGGGSATVKILYRVVTGF
jgi:hypothetical protein